jgi:hypothetical protein
MAEQGKTLDILPQIKAIVGSFLWYGPVKTVFICNFQPRIDHVRSQRGLVRCGLFLEYAER